MKRRNQQEPDFSSLTKLDCLIIAQSVYELGASSWPAVAKLLSKHPLLSHPKSFFTAQSCQGMYKHLMQEASLEITEEDSKRHSPLNRKLAQIQFHARILELRDLIGVEEHKYKKLVSEIEELKKNGVGNVKEDLAEDFTSDLSGISSTSSPGKADVEDKGPTPTPVEPPLDQAETAPSSPQVVEKDLLDPEPEETAEDEKIKEDLAEVADQTKRDDNTPQPMITVDTPVTTHTDLPVDPEDEVSRSSQAPTPYEEAEPDRMEVADEEGVVSGDEPLQRARQAKAAKRQRKASTPLPRKGRRLRHTSGTEMETVDVVEDVQTPGTIEDETSPVPEPSSSKRQGKRRASSIDDNPRDSRRLRADSEPVDDDDGLGASSSRKRRTENQASKRFQNVIGMLHSQISAHRSGTIFHNPIRSSEAPDYHEIVKRPMDLKTIKSKIKDGVISNSLEFQRDIYLMFANAMMYNRPGSDVYIMTEDMMLESEGYIQTFRQSEGFVRGSQR